jgi:hypothetical protein
MSEIDGTNVGDGQSEPKKKKGKDDEETKTEEEPSKKKNIEQLQSVQEEGTNIASEEVSK